MPAIAVACSSSTDDSRSDSGGASASSAASAASAPPGTLASGTLVEATIQDTILSGRNVRGDSVRAVVSRNVVDAQGQIIIAGGASVTLVITVIAPPTTDPDAANDGRVELDAALATVGDSTRALSGRATGVRYIAQPSRGLLVSPGTPVTITLTRPFSITAS